MAKSNFTKAQKEELAQIFLEQLKKLTPAFACNLNSGLELEALGKKWEDGAKDYYDCNGKHMVIATEDYVDPITGKKYFTWEEAMALEKEGKLPEGWSIPTVADWSAIALKYGYREMGDGGVEESGDYLKEELGLDYNGLVYSNDIGDYSKNLKDSSGTVYYVGTYGYYWSASATSTASGAYGLHFYSGGVYPQGSNDKYNGLSVRCVKSVELTRRDNETVPEPQEEPEGIKSVEVRRSYRSDESKVIIEYSNKEEAIDAYEKILAWKRLEEKGLSFRHWKEAPLRPHSSCIAITGNMDCDEEARADLDLLFGGEE